MATQLIAFQSQRKGKKVCQKLNFTKIFNFSQNSFWSMQYGLGQILARNHEVHGTWEAVYFFPGRGVQNLGRTSKFFFACSRHSKTCAVRGIYLNHQYFSKKDSVLCCEPDHFNKRKLYNYLEQKKSYHAETEENFFRSTSSGLSLKCELIVFYWFRCPLTDEFTTHKNSMSKYSLFATKIFSA